MTPGARLTAAIELLDTIINGEPAERALTRWARNSRFAGSKDRAAVRDLVFDGLRRRRSLGWLGGADTGRAITLAGQSLTEVHPDELFTGEGFNPAPLSDPERHAILQNTEDAPLSARLDIPEFLSDELQDSLGDDFELVLTKMQARAPVDLRVNTLKTSSNAAIVVLARDGVHTERLPKARNGLRVLENPRIVGNSRAYSQGMVELQDLSSQLAAEFAGAEPGMTVLDFCAGGGGKTLALAADMEGVGRMMAWDANARRMSDLPKRAGRAGVSVSVLSDDRLKSLGAVCDIVFVDAPCSGTGAWRRKPDGKWRLTEEKLASFPPLQDHILNSAKKHVRSGGHMVYATCSLLRRENEDRVASFLEHNPDWMLVADKRFSPADGGDGFYVARMRAPGRT